MAMYHEVFANGVPTDELSVSLSAFSRLHGLSIYFAALSFDIFFFFDLLL
jgi:hypothetical protein